MPKDFILVTQGVCRFKLDMKIHEAPLQINKVTIIENFQILQGKLHAIQIYVDLNKTLTKHIII